MRRVSFAIALALCALGPPVTARQPLPAVALEPVAEGLIQIDQRLHSLGEDADVELYLMTTAQGIPVGNTGKVWKLVPAGGR